MHDAAIVRTERVLWLWHRIPERCIPACRSLAAWDGLPPAGPSRDAIQGELP
jgi:hypothetical protein